MIALLRFQGTIARRPYFLASVAALLAHYLLQYGVMHLLHALPDKWDGIRVAGDWNYWVRFPGSLAGYGLAGSGAWNLESWLLLALLLIDVAIAYLLLVLAVGRARAGGQSLVRACLAVVPILQIPAIIWLALHPDRAAGVQTPERVPLAVAFKGMLAGVLLTLVLAVMSTLLLRVYGFGLFIASPFFMGCATAYIGNRRAAISATATTRLVFGACFLGGLGLLAFAIEGLVCLVMAIPLIMLMAWIGGLIGRAIALKGPGGAPGSTAMSVFVLPLFFAVDIAVPPTANFESVESIEVAATSEAVWDAIVHMGPIPDPPIAPFRWGLAYPMSGTIHGEGAGAIREGVFSTGIAYERVTVWEPGRRLEFIVLSDPPRCGS